MIIIIIVSVIRTIFFTLPLAKNPLSLLLIIIIISLIIATIYRISLSSWYAFLIFLIYVRGILVIFAYFAATTPNQRITTKSLFFNLFIISIPVFSFSFLTYKTYPILKTKEIQLTDIYSHQNGIVLIFITLVLLLTIIIIVKITKHSKGPMRPFYNYVPTIP